MKILLVTTRYPWPPRRGLELRALQFAEWLAAEHEVTLLAPRAAGRRQPPAALPFQHVAYDGGVARAVAGLGRAAWRGWPAQAGLYAHRALAAAIREHTDGADLVILQLVRLAPHLAAAGSTPLAVDLIDCLGLSFRRRAELDRRWRRWLWRAEAARLERWEREMVRRATAAWVVSERDRAHLVAGLAPEAAARLEVLPPGIGEGEVAAPRPQVDSLPLLAVTGNLGYFATAEGLRWWLDEVWPAARARHPRASLLIAGARPPRWLRRAARGGVRLVEEPDDLGALLATATVALVPARAGAGVPMKILEAWAAGVPVIAHPWSAAGAGGEPGRDLLTAATPAEWLAALGLLLDAPAERARLAAAGRERLRAAFAPAALASRLRATVRQAVALGRPGPTPRSR